MRLRVADGRVRVAFKFVFGSGRAWTDGQGQGRGRVSKFEADENGRGRREVSRIRHVPCDVHVLCFGNKKQKATLVKVNSSCILCRCKLTRFDFCGTGSEHEHFEQWLERFPSHSQVRTARDVTLLASRHSRVPLASHCIAVTQAEAAIQ